MPGRGKACRGEDIMILPSVMIAFDANWRIAAGNCSADCLLRGRLFVECNLHRREKADVVPE